MTSSPIATGQPYIQPLAAWRVMLGDTDLTDRLAPRLIALSLAERRGEEADSLELTLHDTDGALTLPPAGVTLRLALGWQRGTGVIPGLIDKGTFVVQDVEWETAPATGDRMTIRARSADLRTTLQNPKNRTFTDTTIGQIIAQLAADNALTPRCHPDLADHPVTAIEQANQSDIALLRDLGRRYDAAATIKAGTLLFTPNTATTTPTGATLPTITLTRPQISAAHYTRAARESTQDGAQAQYHDQATARRHTVTTGGHTPRRLKRLYASPTDAQAAARGEEQRLMRAAATMRLTLPLGDAALTPGARVEVQGFKDEIDAREWLVTSVRHDIGPDGGFATEIEAEVAE